jgi:dienelactone hydrolase
MLRVCLLFLVLVGPFGAVNAAVVSEPVEYRAGDTVLKGFLAYDDSSDARRPAVLVVHEWWGHNDYARQRAVMLAELGYVALAVDMYGDGKQAMHPDEAGKFAGEISANLPEAQARFMAAMDVVKNHPATDPEHIAAIGYCFGGAVVLNMARLGVDLDGVASFHGSLGTSHPAQPGKVLSRMLVLHGADDPFVPAEQVAQFKAEMDKAAVDYRFIAYPGAVHAFTNPDADRYGEQFNLPLKYNAAADRASWSELGSFLEAVFE